MIALVLAVAAPLQLISTAPRFLDKRPGCCVTDSGAVAHSWPRMQVGLQVRCSDWSHGCFAPQIVATGPETQPGMPCTLFVAHGLPGDTFVYRWVNTAGPSCWGGRRDTAHDTLRVVVPHGGTYLIPLGSTSWKPIEGW